MATRATSYRVDPRVKDRLAQQAATEGLSERALLERLISEGLDALAHPGIVFRDGPSGRRAGLAAGPDVWEVASALRWTTGSAEEQVAQVAEQFDLHPRHIRTAIDYAATHRDRIHAEVDANDRAAERARAVSDGRTALLAS